MLKYDSARTTGETAKSKACASVTTTDLSVGLSKSAAMLMTPYIPRQLRVMETLMGFLRAKLIIETQMAISACITFSAVLM